LKKALEPDLTEQRSSYFFLYFSHNQQKSMIPSALFLIIFKHLMIFFQFLLNLAVINFLFFLLIFSLNSISSTAAPGKTGTFCKEMPISGCIYCIFPDVS